MTGMHHHPPKRRHGSRQPMVTMTAAARSARRRTRRRIGVAGRRAAARAARAAGTSAGARGLARGGPATTAALAAGIAAAGSPGATGERVCTACMHVHGVTVHKLAHACARQLRLMGKRAGAGVAAARSGLHLPSSACAFDHSGPAQETGTTAGARAQGHGALHARRRPLRLPLRRQQLPVSCAAPAACTSPHCCLLTLSVSWRRHASLM